jgi:hypothetical protein
MADMERMKVIHRAFAGANVIAVFGGLAYGNAPIDLNVILLSVVFTMLRVKMWFDDEAYLSDVEKGVFPGGLSYGFGMLLAVTSWILWGFAGFFIKDVEHASLILLIVVVVGTFWIVAAMVKRGAYAEQIPWLFFNVLYGLFFSLLYWRNGTWNIFRVHLGGFTTGVLASLILTFLMDLSITRILEQKRRG